MLNREERRANFKRQHLTTLAKLADACAMLPRVKPDGSSECSFAATLYFRKEEAVIPVQKLKDEREGAIEGIRERIEEARNKSTEPWWATEDDHDAGTPRFEAYCSECWENEKAIEETIRELNEEIAGIKVEIEVIDEFLAKAAEKCYPGELRDEFGCAPGEESTFNLRNWQEEKVQRFLEG